MPSRDPSPAPGAPSGPVAFGPFVLDLAQARLSRDGAVQALNGRALAVLGLLAARAGQLVDKDAILDGVWGHQHVSESVLKNAINTVRAALGDDAQQPRYVETVPRRGYRFIAACRAVEAAAPAAGAAPVQGNLPQPAGALVGRGADVALLAGLLREHRLVTITGLGGIGKTRLALQAAGVDAPPDGAWLLRLEALDAADGGAAMRALLAQTLRLGPSAAASDETLGRALAPMKLRLVLDNAEHLVDTVAALAGTLLAAVPGLQLLVTSQVPLRLAGEQVMLLAPLALPAALADAAPDPGSYAAAQLFCERLQQRMPGYQPSAGEHADIAAICRALDGVPLALELAAARVPLLGVAGVRARLDQRFAMLTHGARDAAARHRTLGAALDWTYGLLGEPEQRALQALALFAGSFSAADAESLLDDVAALDQIESLRERSLVVVEPTPEGPRLRLFDSVRRHALARLADSGGEAPLRQRHLSRLLVRFERAELEAFGTPAERWLPPLRLELDNLRAALHFGLDAGADAAHRDPAARLLAHSSAFWYRSGLRAEGLKWFEHARAQALGDGTRLLLDHAWGLFVNFAQAGAPADALAALRRSRPALLAAGDHHRSYLSFYAERMLLLRVAPQQDPTELIEGMRAQLQPGWGALERRHLGMLEALAARDRGDFEGYLRRCSALIGPCRAAGGRVEVWTMENGLAQALALMGRLDEACAQLRLTVDDVRQAGLQREQVPVLAIAASLHLRRGADAFALSLAHEALRLLDADGMVWWMADALPWAAWHGGRPADAARLQGWADAKVRTRGDSRGPVFGRLREAFDAALAAHPDHARLAALLADAAAAEPMADERAIRLAFEGRDAAGRTLAG